MGWGVLGMGGYQGIHARGWTVGVQGDEDVQALGYPWGWGC